MKLFEQPSIRRSRFSALIAIIALHGGAALAAEPTESTPSVAPMGLMGDWCYIKKRRVTKYTVKEGRLDIRSGRSGRFYEADLSCNEDRTECKAKTVRGWDTPVTEILRQNGEKMQLTRIWGGSWNGKTYNFTFTRCPKM